MVRIFIGLIAILFINIYTYSQATFSKKYTDPGMEDMFFSCLAHYQDTLYALVWVRNKTEVWKMDGIGNVIMKRKFHWMNHYLVSTGGNKRMMFDTRGDIFVSGVFDNSHGLLKLNRNLDSLWFKSFVLHEASFVSDVSMTETKDYIVLQGQAQYNFSPVFVAHLIWLDKEGNLDTMIVHNEVNEIGNIKQGRIKTDKDDNVVFVYGRLFNDPNFPLWHDVYKGVLKYNKNKEVIWEWESPEKISEDISGDFVFTSNGDIIFIDVGGAAHLSKDPFLTCLGKDKNILWRTQVSLPRGQGKFIFGIDNYSSNEFIIYGTHSFYDSISAPNNHGFVSKYNDKGQSLWERTYINYMGSEYNNQEIPIEYYSFYTNFRSFTLDSNKSILLGGVNFVISPEVGQENAFLIKLDSFGCLNNDRCNEINETEPVDFFQFYDQIPILQKSMIYGSKNADGSWLRYSQSFGKDTFAADTRYGVFIFKEVWYENMDTGEKSKDFRRVRYWHPEGRVSFATKNNPRPEHLLWTFQTLYDFTLEEGDSFELADSLGTATVILIDTFYLKDGAARKRITLRHDDETFNQNHGDIVWVEGIGNIKGSFFYQDDWKLDRTTELLCYFDRDQKRYYSPNSVDCLLSNTKDESQKYKITVFPNPVNQSLQFTSDPLIQMTKIEIMDVSGRKIWSRSQYNGEADVSYLTAGVYFINFYTKNGLVYTQKFVKL